MFPNPFFKRPDTARYTTLRCPFTIHESKKKIYLKPPKSQVSILQMSRYIHFHWKKKRKTGRTFDRSEIPNSGCPSRYRYHAHAACSMGRRPVRLWTWQKFGQVFLPLGEAILESWNQGAESRLIFPKLKFHGCQDLNPKVQRWSGYEVWLVPNLRLKQKLGAQLSLLDWKTLRFS